jgi:hypothetical protein
VYSNPWFETDIPNIRARASIVVNSVDPQIGAKFATCFTVNPGRAGTFE